MAADQAPDHMPVTGGESNNGLNMALIAALVVFLLGALAVASRRRVA
jgi:hydrogenase-4 membrane subunit HyfE